MVRIDKSKCINCARCQRACVSHIFEMRERVMQVKEGDCIKCGHCAAVCPQNAILLDWGMESEILPMSDKKIEKEELLNFMMHRRTMRRFKNRKVPKEVMEELIEAGRYAPTAHNEQDTEYLVVESKLPEIRDRIWESLNKDACDKKNYQMQKNYKVYKKNAQEDSLFYGLQQVLFIYADKEINGIIAASYIELLAYAMELGVFYCGYAIYGIQQDDDLKKEYGVGAHGKKLAAILGIGYPDIAYIRSVPRNKAKISWI